MKILLDIPLEKYDDIPFVYNFLNENKTIGNENAEYNGLWHIHWRGPIENNKIILQLKSILATQYVEKIYFWIESPEITKNSSNYPNLKQLEDEGLVEVKVFDRSIISQAPGGNNMKGWVIQYYEQQTGDYRYRTDMFRWIVLSVYGGVYTDADTLMLRDVRDIKINNWSSKWGTDPYIECCILKLEKGSDAYEQMFRNDPRNPQCFLNIQNNLPEAFNWKYDNLRVTSLPSSFFDIAWTIDSITESLNIPYLKESALNTFESFFKETNEEISYNNFLKGCFAYHWHNRWNSPELKDSPAGKLNADIDKIIEKKYKIKPNPIFQD